MKVGLLTGPGELQVVDRPEPIAGPGEAIVRMAACGVCGTDLEKLRGGYQSAGRIGHEPVGIVASVGAEVTTLSEGDRVFVHHHVPCRACEVCRKGDFTFCPKYASSNIEPGGFSELFRVPSEHVLQGAALRLAPNVSWDEGALLEPAGCALTALRRVGFQAGASVFIVGLGPVGLLYARLASALGAGWVGGAEPSTLRREAAARWGMATTVDARDASAVQQAVATATHGEGVDLAVVATGLSSAITLTAKLPRRGGALNLFGLPESGSRLDVDLQELYLRGIRIIPTYATTERDIAEVHALVTSGRLRIKDLVSHRVPLEDLGGAFAQAARPQEALKVVVTGPAYLSA